MDSIRHNTAELFAAKALASQVKTELVSGIIPFWTKRMTAPGRGFFGRISGEGILDKEAPLGAIMNARILWTFSSAARVLSEDPSSKEVAASCMDTALRAKKEITERFYDKEFGGIYWSLHPDGTPEDTKKQIYAIAFAIYGLAEYHRATGDAEALEYAVKLFRDIEEHSFDNAKNGYFEAFTREWNTIGDMRLSNKDANESKTMNTHLHVLEAYTCLYRVWKDELLKKRLAGLIDIFCNVICGKDGHLRLFFDDDWNCNYNIISYGHDIEASWLLYEAAQVLGDEEVISKVGKLAVKIATASCEGLGADGGMIYEKHGKDGPVDGDRHWWVQAETVVGCINTWNLTGDGVWLEKALSCWDFIKSHIIDSEGGEWFWSLRADGTPNKDDDKAGFWKCPYHNGRMCMEVIERTSL
ncbi:MAG: AGE family epimerase/isomerase [Candidatus Cryptobacteroides sp.]